MRMARIYSKCSKCGQMGYIGSGTDCVKCENPVPTDADRITQLERDLSEARRERDEARAQLDTYIRTAADAVAEQGRMEAAGRVLAAEVYDFAAAFAFDTGQEVLTHVSEDVKSNPLTLAWVRQAQEASNGN